MSEMWKSKRWKNMKKLTKFEPKEIATTDFKKLSKKELLQFAEDFMLPFSHPDKYKELVKSRMPDLVKDLDNREIAGTAMAQSAQEMMLAIVETLKLYNGFTDGQIDQFLKDLKGNITVVEKIEEGGLSMLSDHSMKQIVQMVKETGVEAILQKIADVRYRKESMWKSGLEHPNILEGSKIEKRIQKAK